VKGDQLAVAVLRTSNSIMSAPTSIAFVKASMVFSAAPDATPGARPPWHGHDAQYYPSRLGTGNGGTNAKSRVREQVDLLGEGRL